MARRKVSAALRRRRRYRKVFKSLPKRRQRVDKSKLARVVLFAPRKGMKINRRLVRSIDLRGIDTP